MKKNTAPLKIGIIDSGISKVFLRTAPIKIAAGAAFEIDWSQKRLNSTFYNETEISNWRDNNFQSNNRDLAIADQSGHGTAVASIIHRHIQRPVEFYIAKILDEQVSGSAICLLAAMKWLVQQMGTDYINLSLGTTSRQLHSQMQELATEAQLKNCQLFSAAGDIPTLPSELMGVTSVGTTELAKQHNPEVKLDYVALPTNLIIFRENSWIEVDISTSFACPLLLAEHCNIHINSY